MKCFNNLGLTQTLNFSCADSNLNELNSLICFDLFTLGSAHEMSEIGFMLEIAHDFKKEYRICVYIATSRTR